MHENNVFHVHKKILVFQSFLFTSSTTDDLIISLNFTSFLQVKLPNAIATAISLHCAFATIAHSERS